MVLLLHQDLAVGFDPLTGTAGQATKEQYSTYCAEEEKKQKKYTKYRFPAFYSWHVHHSPETSY